MLNRFRILAILILAGCSKSDDDSGAAPAVPAPRAAAVAGADQEAVPGYATSFEADGTWTLDAAVGGVGWAMDATPTTPRTGAASLNYNNGTDFNNGGANSGAATSAEIGIAGHTSPVLVFWCNYSTETTGTAKDKRWLRLSTNNFSTTVLNQQLSGAALAPYQCAAMGTWHRHVVPLNPDWGRVRVRFFFESVDSGNNGFAGWAVDDLSVEVRLSGAGSSDPAVGALAYAWTQTGGTAVTLSDPAAQEPHFLAPALTGTAADLLTFRLAVTGPSGTDTDTVRVQLKSRLVGAPDTWFVGYGKSGTITAKVAGDPAGVSYAWTGVEPWLAVSGTSSDILGYTAPALADFQNFPDRADVAILQRASQGRLQLKVSILVAAAVVDEDFVNFSVGPFPNAVANENLTIGEPAFLNGAKTALAATPVTTWTWIGKKPNGNAVSFFKPDKTALASLVPTGERYAYFIPDLPGDYEIQIRLNDGQPASETTKVLILTAGTFVGVGNRVGTPPDPFKGECASCHAGQFGWLADMATPWTATGHAKAFESLLDPVNPLYAPSQAKGHWLDAFNFGSQHSIDARTVGWSRINAAASGGWAEKAAASGFVLGEATWDETVRKHASVAALSGVQCESCHGPGSEHRADTTAIRKTFDAEMCGRCHGTEAQAWQTSGHGKPPIASPSGNASCNNCHTAQGYVVDARAQKNADPHPVLVGVPNLNRPVIPSEDRRGTTCQACHDPHERTPGRGTPAGDPDPQLRVFGQVKFLNDAVASAGNAATCYMCHQSRRDAREGSPDFNARRGTHDSTSGEMLSATNAMEFSAWGSYASSPHAIPGRFISPLFGENRQCLACHKDASPVAGAPGFGVLGAHTFAMKQGTGTVVADEVSHTGGGTVVGTRKFSVAAGPTFLSIAAPGDVLTIAAGDHVGAYTVASVDGARQLTLAGTGDFTGPTASDWSLTSALKHNVASCSQCHAPTADFNYLARGDYDDDGNFLEPVQDEIAGLLVKLKAAIDVKLSAYTGVATTLEVGSSIKYHKTIANVSLTFPGPGVSASSNPEITWASLPEDDAILPDKKGWTALYKAAYNIMFVENDRSQGIHNTGYTVNLLQASHEAVTELPWPSAKRFVPFP